VPALGGEFGVAEGDNAGGVSGPGPMDMNCLVLWTYPMTKLAQTDELQAISWLLVATHNPDRQASIPNLTYTDPSGGTHPSGEEREGGADALRGENDCDVSHIPLHHMGLLTSPVVLSTSERERLADFGTVTSQRRCHTSQLTETRP
jgi:hypothetical protein